jgi:hypothetical protein
MMRPIGKFVLTLGALALLAAPAWAQQGRGGFMMGGGAGFLMAPNVQKDLKLSDTQVEKIQPTLRELREKHQDAFAALRDASPEERPAKVRALSKTFADDVKKALSLSDEQSKRFDQISLQMHGLQSFHDPVVAEKLKLTDDQKSKLREIAEASRGAFAGAFNKDASEEERAEARKKMVATQKENMTKMQALLSSDQKKAWKDLTGEPIEIQFPTRRPNN